MQINLFIWQIIRNITVSILRIILRLLWIFPVKKNRIFFTSYNGKKYSCNPKYIFEYLNIQFDHNLEYIWCLDDNSIKIPGSCKQVARNSFLNIFYSITSGIYITNDGISSFLPFRKKQFIINTWHGGGVYKSSGLGGNSQLNKSDKLSIQMMAKNLTWFISSSEAFSRNMHSFYLIPMEKMLPIGMPRNDLFFNPDIYEKIRLRIRNEFKIDNDYGIVIYTPTFRGAIQNKSSLTSDIDIPRLLMNLQKRFGKPYKFMVRVHHAVKHSTSVDSVIDVSSYPDSQELLCAADVLVSDYSSILWDFSLTYKPCFIYAPDKESYQSMDRGFSSDIANWPFPMANSNDTLEQNILLFRDKKYTEAVKNHHNSLGSYEHGSALQAISSLIKEKAEIKD